MNTCGGGGGGGKTMAANAGEEESDFYAVLGLKKECTATELRIAYKKLALIWHPDRCCASGDIQFVEDAKKKFQSIQEAYSVLSDRNKRFLYDVGIYDKDNDSENEMGDFLSEMVDMMSQTKPSDKEESFEEFQQLFEDIFKTDINQGFGRPTHNVDTTTYMSSGDGSNSNDKRNHTEIIHEKEKSSGFLAQYQSFCIGLDQHQDTRKRRGGVTGRQTNSRKQKVSSGDYSGISA